MSTYRLEEIPSHCSVLGVKVAILTISELHQCMVTSIRRQEKSLVLNVNVNCLNLAYDLQWLKDYLNMAEIVFCDGAGVMLGARILGYHIPERITFADWLWQLAEFAEPRGWTFFFLGARPGVAEKATHRLQERYPKLKVVGCQHGYFDKSLNSPENQAVVHRINRLKPNILLIGFGMPKQEKWLKENWTNIEANIALTGGAVFDYLSGELRRAPWWMTNNGLEWLGRLIIEPGRLWKRYLIGNPLFLLRIFRQRYGFHGRSG